MAGPCIYNPDGTIKPPKCGLVINWAERPPHLCKEPADFVVELEEGRCIYLCAMHLRTRNDGYKGIVDINNVRVLWDTEEEEWILIPEDHE